MEKTVLAAASYYKRGYSFQPAFDAIPQEVQKEIRIMLTIAAEKTRGVVSMGFYEDGRVYAEVFGDENDFDYDEIAAAETINALVKEKEALFESLRVWYLMQKSGNLG